MLRDVNAAAPPADDPAGNQTTRALLGLRQMVLDGELPPGTRVTEPMLADRLGVSRTPVRAALARLTEEGLLQALPAGGYLVEAFTEADIFDAIEIRGTMEGLAARLAAERGVPAALLADLRRCVAECDDVLTGGPGEATFQRYIDVNRRFHELLTEAAGSAVLARQIERARNLPFASASGFVMVQAVLPESFRVLQLAQEQHRAIVEAIERREGTRAEALAREHARIAHRNLQAALHSHEAMQRLPGAKLIRRSRLR